MDGAGVCVTPLPVALPRARGTGADLWDQRGCPRGPEVGDAVGDDAMADAAGDAVSDDAAGDNSG